MKFTFRNSSSKLLLVYFQLRHDPTRFNTEYFEKCYNVWESEILVILLFDDRKLSYFDHVNRIILWFNFILGSIFTFRCFSLIFIYYHAQKQRKMKIEAMIKLKHNRYIQEQCFF